MTSTAQEPVEYTETTPSGIEVLYSPSPRRLYKVRGPVAKTDWMNESEPVEDWVEVPSVTSVLGLLDKPGLSWWGMKVGIEGTAKLVTMGYALLHTYPTDQVVDLLTENKLTVNHVKNKAGDRGVAVHDALEAWARYGHKPDPDSFPDEQKGYVEGLLQFLEHVPSAEPVAAEVMVGSLQHGFAGRYDIRFRTSQPHQVVFKRTPKRGPQWATLAPGLYLGDLKTSKGVYLSHSRQLEAYELASVECGYEPTEARGVLHVSADGTYEFSRGVGTAEDFLCVLSVWKSEQAMKERKR